ncbi:MAG: hypothetical protein SF187_18290 [Deltaproteobacteria bacterium]|nr:hypothetical protein [Deltaproteobacteria bacterium]
MPFKRATLLSLLALAACDFGGGKSGVEAPLNRIFLPSGAAVVAQGKRLLVVNSNSDLRYSTGTVVPFNLQAATEDRDPAKWQLCPSVDYRPKVSTQRFCCRDLLDPRVLSCDDRPYAEAEATVRIGSFGAAPVVQRFVRNGESVERLFFGVRADPSVTFVDATDVAGKAKLTCNGAIGGPGSARKNPQCDGAFRVEKGTVQGLDTDLPEEPFDLHLDAGLGVIYVGHLQGGISVLDTCGAEVNIAPRLAGVLFFPYEANQSSGVTSAIPSVPGDPLSPVFTTARLGLNLGVLYFREGANLPGACSVTAPRDLTLVAAAPSAATAFVPRGADTRGLIYQPQRQRAFILYRNTQGNPAALSRARVVANNVGRLEFAPAESIDVCAGPSQLLLHDYGRGPRLFVTCFDSGQIYVVDPELMVVTENIDVGRGPSMLVFDDNDPSLAYVTGFVDNNVSVVDLRVNSPTEARVIQRIGFPRTSAQL